MFITNLLSNPIAVIAFVVALILSITIHEYAHAYVAFKCGDPTAKYLGRLTLNPIAHLDPLGTLLLFIVGFGWGKPVPINSHNFSKKEDELKVAGAGIIANILFALILGIPLRVANMRGIAIDSSIWLSFINVILEINLILAAFNILPIFPLDGSHFIEYLLSDRAKDAYRSIGPYILLGLLFIGYTTNISIISMIMEPILRVLSLLVKGTYATF